MTLKVQVNSNQSFISSLLSIVTNQVILITFLYLQVKTTYVVDGNTVTQKVTAISRPELGTATFKREYNGDELVVVSKFIFITFTCRSYTSI